MKRRSGYYVLPPHVPLNTSAGTTNDDHHPVPSTTSSPAAFPVELEDGGHLNLTTKDTEAESYSPVVPEKIATSRATDGSSEAPLPHMAASSTHFMMNEFRTYPIPRLIRLLPISMSPAQDVQQRAVFRWNAPASSSSPITHSGESFVTALITQDPASALSLSPSRRMDPAGGTLSPRKNAFERFFDPRVSHHIAIRSPQYIQRELQTLLAVTRAQLATRSGTEAALFELLLHKVLSPSPTPPSCRQATMDGTPTLEAGPDESNSKETGSDAEGGAMAPPPQMKSSLACSDDELTVAEKLLYIILRTSVLANMGFPSSGAEGVVGGDGNGRTTMMGSSGSTSSTETLVRKKGRGETDPQSLWPRYRHPHSTTTSPMAPPFGSETFTAEHIFQNEWGLDQHPHPHMNGNRPRRIEMATAMPLQSPGPRCWLTPDTITMIEGDASLKRQMRWSSGVDPVVYATLVPDPVQLSRLPAELCDPGEQVKRVHHSMVGFTPSVRGTSEATTSGRAEESISWGGGAPGAGFYASSADVEQLFQSTPGISTAPDQRSTPHHPVAGTTTTSTIPTAMPAHSPEAMPSRVAPPALPTPAFAMFHKECPPVVVASVHVALHRCVVGLADPYWLTVTQQPPSASGRSAEERSRLSNPAPSPSPSPSKSRLKRFALSNPVVMEPYIELNRENEFLRERHTGTESDTFFGLRDDEPITGGAVKRWKSDLLAKPPRNTGGMSSIEGTTATCSSPLPRGLLTLLSQSCECGTLVLRLQRLCDLAELPERRPALGTYGECALDALRHVLDVLRRHAQDLSLVSRTRARSFEALLEAHRALEPFRDTVVGLAEVFGVSTDPDWDGSQALLRLSSATLLSTLYERFMIQQANSMENYFEGDVWENPFLDDPLEGGAEEEEENERRHRHSRSHTAAEDAGSAIRPPHMKKKAVVVPIGFGQILGYLLRSLLHPLSRMLTDWLTRGICTDPLDEFFIVPSHGRTASGYTLDTSPHRLPSFISPETAALLLHAGLSLRALREASSNIVSLASAASQPNRLSKSDIQEDLPGVLAAPFATATTVGKAVTTAHVVVTTEEEACATKWMVQEFVDSILGRTPLLGGETERGTAQDLVRMPTVDLFSPFGGIAHWQRFYDACNAVLVSSVHKTTGLRGDEEDEEGEEEEEDNQRRSKREMKMEVEDKHRGVRERAAAVPLNSASLEVLRGRPSDQPSVARSRSTTSASTSAASHITIVMHSSGEDEMEEEEEENQKAKIAYRRAGKGRLPRRTSSREEVEGVFHSPPSSPSSSACLSSGSVSFGGTALSPRFGYPGESGSRSDLSTNSSRVSLALYGAILQEHRHVQRAKHSVEATEQTQVALKADFLRSTRQRRWRERMQAWKLERLTLRPVRQVALMDEVEEVRAAYDSATAPGPSFATLHTMVVAEEQEEEGREKDENEHAGDRSSSGGAEEKNPWLGRLVIPLLLPELSAEYPPWPSPQAPSVALYPNPEEMALLRRGRVRFSENVVGPARLTHPPATDEEEKDSKMNDSEALLTEWDAQVPLPAVDKSIGEEEKEQQQEEEESSARPTRDVGLDSEEEEEEGPRTDSSRPQSPALSSSSRPAVLKKRKGKLSKKTLSSMRLEMPSAAAIPKRRAQVERDNFVPPTEGTEGVNTGLPVSSKYAERNVEKRDNEEEEEEGGGMIMEVVEVLSSEEMEGCQSGEARLRHPLETPQGKHKDGRSSSMNEESSMPNRQCTAQQSEKGNEEEVQVKTKESQKDVSQGEGVLTGGDGTKVLFFDDAGFPHYAEYYKVGDINDDEYFHRRNGPSAFPSRAAQQEELNTLMAKVLETEAREQAFLNTASPAYWRYCEQMATYCVKGEQVRTNKRETEREKEEEREDHQNLSTTLRPSSVEMDLSLSSDHNGKWSPTGTGLGSGVSRTDWDFMKFSAHWRNDMNQIFMELNEVRDHKESPDPRRSGSAHDRDAKQDDSSTSSRHHDSRITDRDADVKNTFESSSHRLALRSTMAFSSYVNTLRLSASEAGAMRACSSYYLQLGMFTCRTLTHKALQLLLLPPYGPLYRLLVQLIDVFLLQSPLAASTVTNWWHPYASTLMGTSDTVTQVLDGGDMLRQLNHLLREDGARQLADSPDGAHVGTRASMELELVLQSSVVPSAPPSAPCSSHRPGNRYPSRSRRPSKRWSTIATDNTLSLPYTGGASRYGGVVGRPTPHSHDNEDDTNESRFLPHTGEAVDKGEGEEVDDVGDCKLENRYTNPIDFLNDLSVQCRGPPHVRWVLPPDTMGKTGDLFCSLLLWKSMEQLVTQTWKRGLESGVPDVFFFCNVARQVFIGIQQHLWDSLGRSSRTFREKIALDSPSLYVYTHLEQFTAEMDHFLESCRFAALLTPGFQPCRGLLYSMLQQLGDVFHTVTRCNQQVVQLRDELLEKLETDGPNLDPKDLLRNDPYVVVSTDSALDRHAPKVQTMPTLHDHSMLWQPFKELKQQYVPSSAMRMRSKNAKGGSRTTKRNHGKLSVSPSPRSSPKPESSPRTTTAGKVYSSDGQVEFDSDAARYERMLLLLRVAMNEVTREQHRQREVIQSVVRHSLLVFCDYLHQLSEIMQEVVEAEGSSPTTAPIPNSFPPSARNNKVWNPSREEVHHLEVLVQNLKQLEKSMKRQIMNSS